MGNLLGEIAFEGFLCICLPLLWSGLAIVVIHSVSVIVVVVVIVGIVVGVHIRNGMFVDILLGDELLHLSWQNHLCKVYRCRRFGGHINQGRRSIHYCCGCNDKLFARQVENRVEN